MSKHYDSTDDTKEHQNTVKWFIEMLLEDLTVRRAVHDLSKLQAPEKAIFDEYTPKLKGTTYGSDEYKKFFEEMQVALKHHYENNTHHPEHFENGVRGMTLVDVVEMLCDWRAATERHADGDIRKSIELNQERFGYSDELKQIFLNTIDAYGW